jgi:hypothetical protein
MKAQLNALKLVFPPLSNQEAEWLKDDPDVQAILKSSNLYMIGQRREAKFVYPDKAIETLKKTFKFHFQYCSGNLTSNVTIDIKEMLRYYEVDVKLDDILFESGDKYVRIWNLETVTKTRNDLIYWTTTEKLLYDKSRDLPFINGFDKFIQFTEYYLHYVGISKKTDSLRRLVIQPHDKRLRVLSNEDTKNYGSRLTDEIILFFFEIEPLLMTVIETEEEINEMVNGIQFDNIRIIADAEKALLHILEAKYNEVTFSDYPKGIDGLYNTGLKRYGYFIQEDISFITDTAKIRGKFESHTIPKVVDLIMIEGDEVQFIKSEEMMRAKSEKFD